MKLAQAVLVLVDISGYTQFIEWMIFKRRFANQIPVGFFHLPGLEQQ